MMKLLLITFCFIGMTGFAQNLTPPVGIGTTSPVEALDIRGGLQVGTPISGWGSPLGSGKISVTNSSDHSVVYLGQSTTNYGAFAWMYNATPVNAYMSISSGGGSNPLALQANGGNVGIGTASPQYKLDVAGFGARIKNPATAHASYTSFRMQGPEYANGLEIDFFGQSDIPSNEWTYGAGVGGASIVNVNAKPLVFGTGNIRRMIIDGAGNIGIGTTNTNDVNFKLFVETGIRTRKVKVDQATWPDYVFAPSYKLPSLKEVEQFIKQNWHLPDVQSAEEVKKEGINLGENQALLLKKIEELTLYIIEQNKKNEDQQKEIEALKEERKNHRNSKRKN